MAALFSTRGTLGFRIVQLNDSTDPGNNFKEQTIMPLAEHTVLVGVRVKPTSPSNWPISAKCKLADS
jgi:hypothetical protein